MLTIEKALASRTNWSDGSVGGVLGHFSFRAAQFLVASGHYEFVAVHCWGYLLRRKKA